MKFRYLFILVFKFDNTHNLIMLIIQINSCWKKGEGSEKSQKYEEGTLSKSTNYVTSVYKIIL